ncbi:uncharacterized protein LOC133973069 isoform X3 [Platichthys flesus]|uniref:uncharacterized protein LOC133973069 isoform X3 n=1 Tax=Platichthys flesus TaxID=8260 RepID=UPI002DC0522E|nr:uncharacterized protein LOC133973069 isoform X3 [Platichthys flesus]
MPNESTARDYQSIPDMTQVYRASWKTFYVILSGITNNTHVEFVKMIKSHGHTEVTDPEECDYCLLFCPITSRVGTDVELALRKIPANKPTILVVMYHTFDRYHVVLDSRRLTEDPRVHLTVNSLFHEHNLLNSNCNETAKYEIRKFLELSQNLLSIIRRNPLSITKCDNKHLLFIGVGLVVVILIVLLIFSRHGTNMTEDSEHARQHKITIRNLKSR